MLYKAVTLISFVAVLMLISLKLLGLIPWSWWWVFTPLWIFLVCLGLALSYVAALLIYSWATGRSTS